MNGVVVERQSDFDFIKQADAVIIGSGSGRGRLQPTAACWDRSRLIRPNN